MESVYKTSGIDRTMFILIILSLFMHAVGVFFLPMLQSPRKVSYIELSMEEIPRQVNHAVSPPLPQIKPLENIKPALSSFKPRPPSIRANLTNRHVVPSFKMPALPDVYAAQKQEKIAPPLPQIKPLENIKPALSSFKPRSPSVRANLTNRHVAPSFKMPALPDVYAVQKQEKPTPSVEETAQEETPIVTQAVKADNRVLLSYLANVRVRIEKYKKYPAFARSRRMEGEVSIVFILSENGEARDFRVRKSSGVAILDRAALTAVRHAAPFSKPPTGFINKEMPIALTIVFKII